MDMMDMNTLQQHVVALTEQVLQLQNELASTTAIVHQQTSHLLQPTGRAHAESSAINSGDTSFMIISSALVLFMTIPGLALYYSGMVPTKNVINTIMQSFSICCLITFLWLICGYSLAFGPAIGDADPRLAVFGGGSRLWLIGMTPNSVHQLAPTIPEAVYCVYQLTFAIITPALICGSFANRMKYWPMLLFITLWHLLVYCPVAHANWHPSGFLFRAGVLDFAGGNVVHISSGVAGLMSAIVVGKQHNFGQPYEPYSLVNTFTGMAMLWVGWIGFNAGSAGAANTRAGYALIATQIATALAALSWMLTETLHRKKPSVLGMVNGAIAGLVCITPASGYVEPTGAFFIGLLGGPLCYYGAQLKHWLGYDDALDAFGVHAIGGIVGGFLTGFFASDSVYVAGAFYGNGGKQIYVQLYGILFTITWSGVVSLILLLAIDKTIGLRVTHNDEQIGLDLSIHGETAFGPADSSAHLVNNATMAQGTSGVVPLVQLHQDGQSQSA